MKEYLYLVMWNCGGCNDGDHDAGWEWFGTLQEALEKAKWIRDANGDGELEVVKVESKFDHKDWG